MTANITNWAGNQTFTPSRFHRPETLDELRAIAARAPKLHAIGARHAFNDMAAAPELVSLDRMGHRIEIDRSAMTVSVNAGIRYVELAQALAAEGLALHNLASLPHITVAGAVVTATHGSGDRSGNLATAVTSLELVTSDGDNVRAERSDADFPGMVVNLGALGILHRLTLSVEPAYQMRQDIYEHLAWDVLFERFNDVMSSADSVSLFVDFGPTADQVWRKSRVTEGESIACAPDFLGAQAASMPLNPLRTMSAQYVTEQLGVAGWWWDRLPHFVEAGVTDTGDHLQSEYLVPRQYAVDAIRDVLSLAKKIRPHLLISEIRSVAADDLWLSSSYETDAVGIHFTWKHHLTEVTALLPEIEAILAPYQPRPHWAKLFVAEAADLEPRYPRMADFRTLAARLDPRGAFRNAFLDRTIFRS